MKLSISNAYWNTIYKFARINLKRKYFFFFFCFSLFLILVGKKQPKDAAESGSVPKT